MDNKSWTDKKQKFLEKYGGENRNIIVGIKRGLTHNKLTSIKTAVSHLHSQPSKAPLVAAYLNNLIGHKSLIFRWFPSAGDQSGKMLIRNESIGLIVNAEPNAALQAIVMTAKNNAPYCPLAPEAALSQLSAHMTPSI